MNDVQMSSGCDAEVGPVTTGLLRGMLRRIEQMETQCNWLQHELRKQEARNMEEFVMVGKEIDYRFLKYEGSHDVPKLIVQEAQEEMDLGFEF